MAIAQMTPRTAVTTLPNVSLNARVVLQPHTWYSCPTGKKAIIKGRAQCTGRGAAANTSIRFSGITMFTYNTAGAKDSFSGLQGYIFTPLTLTTDSGGEFCFFEVELAAGEIMETVQNSGTNAEWNVWADVMEFPA